MSKQVGYLVDVPPDAVDAHRFRALVERAGHLGDPGDRAAMYRDALDLWRGPLMADVASAALRERVGRTLDELRLRTLECWLGGELERGGHREMLPDLTDAVAAHPENEQLAALYMLALHRSGRTVEAGEHYARFRRHLVQTSGIDPSRNLGDLHAAILRADATLLRAHPAGAPSVLGPSRGQTATSARRMPGPVTDFVGRTRELAALDRLAQRPRPGPALGIVHGVGGVGKTALVLHWAHAAAANFPDGAVYVDLYGHAAPGPISPEKGLRLVLRQLGLTDDRLPDDAEELTAFYHASMTGCRLLVLDNVPAAAHVRAALPVDANVTLIAVSREALPGLSVHERARQIRLEPMPVDDATQLLAAVSGGRLPDVSPGPLAELARLCDGMPLALRIIGCRLADDPHLEPEAIVAELTPEDKRLAALEIDDEDRGMRGVFDSSYRRLDADLARLFRLLGTLPVVAVSPACAAVAAALPAPDARRLLQSLSRRQLAAPDANGDYRMHELIRLFARERACAEESATDLSAAVRRAADWYLDTAFHAYPLLSPRRAGRAEPDLAHPPAQPLRFTSRDAALAWFGAERDNLVALIRDLGRRGWHRAAAELAGSLFAFYHQHRLWRDWVEAYSSAQESARLWGDWYAESRILVGLGVAYKQLGRYEQAAEAYHRALDIATAGGDVLSTGPILVNLGGLCNTFGRPQDARRHLRAALALPGYSDDPRYSPVLWLNLTHLHYNQGELEQAAECVRRGLAAAAASGDVHTTAYLNHWAGELSLRQRRFDLAAESAATEIEIARAAHDPLRQAYGLDLLASAVAARTPGRARSLWREAQAICAELGHALATDIEKLLHGGPVSEDELIDRRLRVNRLP
ncbi:tetratricopeptide (TPR) repeat protein [Plantactinospora soyae]|uniref:Tetratricopeptide (TPR) repeat protein n=1 Tax=Plantactinospora soyae TaxID=1544732 RepID=A0A927QXX0_9ACTN|nr:BTAD domain-containing putative transcriptional regulator [Plantactinospora soyae]MBE1488550.1 tetratricopeptide (TPR) repeat protein [Plantactinospora soyae]